VHKPGLRNRYSDSLQAGWSGDRIQVGRKVFRIRPKRLWGPPSLLYNGYLVFPGGKAAGAWRWQPTPSSAKVKERVELYLYSRSGYLWPVLWWKLPLTLPLNFPCRYMRYIIFYTNLLRTVVAWVVGHLQGAFKFFEICNLCESCTGRKTHWTAEAENVGAIINQ
jgi:hypothetical protein